MSDSPVNPQTSVTPATSTMELLKAILIATNVPGGRYAFTCARGDSEAILNRVRMKLSRTRKKMMAAGKNFQQFRLSTQVHPLMDSSLELVICTRTQSLGNRIAEAVDDQISVMMARTLEQESN